MDQVREVLTAAGINTAGYRGHSFRIRAATTAAVAGLSKSLIKTLGRWRSSDIHSHTNVNPHMSISVYVTLTFVFVPCYMYDIYDSDLIGECSALLGLSNTPLIS